MRDQDEITSTTFNDSSIVPDAGLYLVRSLMRKLEVEESLCRVLGFSRGRVMARLLLAMCAGIDHIDHIESYRNHPLVKAASSTWTGQVLRSLKDVEVLALQGVLDELFGEVWKIRSDGGKVTLDIDSTVIEVYGAKKVGAHHGYTKVRGYHPQLCVIAGSGEVVGVRFQPGNASTSRDARDFVDECVARVIGSGGDVLCLRADSGYYSHELVALCTKLDIQLSVGIAINAKISKAIKGINPCAWRDINYPDGGQAAVAMLPWISIERGRNLYSDCMCHFCGALDSTQRKLGRGRNRLEDAPGVQVSLVTRRVRHLDPQINQEPVQFGKWYYYALIINQDLSNDNALMMLEAHHRAHAIVERTIRDLKAGPWAHMPSGNYNANALWCLLGAISHNLLIWLDRMGKSATGRRELSLSAMVRRHLIHIPARIITHGRTQTLRLPKGHWQQCRWERIQALLQS